NASAPAPTIIAICSSRNMTGEKPWVCRSIRARTIAYPRVTGKYVLFSKKPSIRHELLKIDGQVLEVKVRLNPRARRMIVKVNPATGEVCVTVRSQRG